LHEIGQPLHAFDADKIAGNKVIVKTLPEGTVFMTLDGTDRLLCNQDLMICDTEKGMCIAGVFGGVNSGVTSNTKNVFLESACFDPVYIRKTSKRLMLQTDASFRFERGTNPNITVFALQRAAALIKELAGGEISSRIVDVNPKPKTDFRVELDYNNVDRLIGKIIDRETIKQILVSLDILIIEEHHNGLVLAVPPYRVDVQREADVIEEILRIYGYNNVEYSEQVKSTIAYWQKPDKNKLENAVADMLASNGFNEAMSNSLTKATYFADLEQHRPENLVKILNPLSTDLNVLRQTLVFSLLEAVAHNINHKTPDLKLFEFGNCYFYNTKQAANAPVKNYLEERHLTIAITGLQNTVNWNTPEKASNFYYLKAFTELVLRRLNYNVDNLEVTEKHLEFLSYGLKYSTQNCTLVEFGQADKKQLKKFDIEADVFIADFNWDMLIKYLPAKGVYTEIPKFPAVRRDLALLIDKQITFTQIKDIAFKMESKLLKDVTIFDVYEGKNIDSNKKSYAISYILQDPQGTLQDKKIDKIMSKLINAYKQELNAQIR